MTHERVVVDLNDIDRQLKESYGAYASYYDTEAAPAHVETSRPEMCPSTRDAISAGSL